MGVVVLLALPLLLVAGLIQLLWAGGEMLMDWFQLRRDRKRAAIERELDRTQVELRGTILRLASELGADAHEARKALIRESYLASGKTPDQ
ncbi:MAG: hypothetical protein JWP19_2242 [Rhodoglobus sp.]|nr:hypothetical protein [Rhodoglobus sp.]